MTNRKKVVAIVGPTASGKTTVGVRLAKEFDGEIISADSRQVYCGLDLGTGKDLSEYDGVKYHMIDIVEPEEKMTLFDYLPLARAKIDDICDRGKLPIIVGGTGLYIQGLVEGFYLQKTKDKKQKINFLRKDLENKSADELCKILYEIDPDKLEMVDKKNNHRLIRAIELAQEGLEPIKKKPDFEVLQIGIEVYRKELHERIDRRVDERFEAGMLEEVTGLLERGVSKEWLINLGLEYREITQYLADDSTDKSQEAMKQQLKYKIHQFARRQITWFKRFPEINWLGDFPEVKRFVKMYLEH